MQKTIRLFDQDSYMQKFDATVLSCEPEGDRFAITLDATAFFPEEGGQCADTGTLGNATVLDVQESEGVIIHYTDAPLTPGDIVHGQLDFPARYLRMQIHSGEHIVSGLMYRRYGFHNVGFHLGGEITMDFDGELSREQLNKIEDAANRIIYENVPITAEYPSADVLRATEYRSKLDLTENVRLQKITEALGGVPIQPDVLIHAGLDHFDVLVIAGDAGHLAHAVVRHAAGPVPHHVHAHGLLGNRVHRRHHLRLVKNDIGHHLIPPVHIKLAVRISC